jgi:hypothetical protein
MAMLMYFLPLITMIKLLGTQNDGAGNFGTQQIITTNANGASSVYATDLDGDGDGDVLSASRIDSKIAWYQNNGTGNFGAQQIITTNAIYATAVYATDLDGDGDADVLSASLMIIKLLGTQTMVQVTLAANKLLLLMLLGNLLFMPPI